MQENLISWQIYGTSVHYNFNTYHHSKDDSAKTEWWSKVKWPWTAAVLELWIYIKFGKDPLLLKKPSTYNQ